MSVRVPVKNRAALAHVSVRAGTTDATMAEPGSGSAAFGWILRACGCVASASGAVATPAFTIAKNECSSRFASSTVSEGGVLIDQVA